jgi:hypothetical protein
MGKYSDDAGASGSAVLRMVMMSAIDSLMVEELNWAPSPIGSRLCPFSDT